MRWVGRGPGRDTKGSISSDIKHKNDIICPEKMAVEYV